MSVRVRRGRISALCRRRKKKKQHGRHPCRGKGEEEEAQSEQQTEGEGRQGNVNSRSEAPEKEGRGEFCGERGEKRPDIGRMPAEGKKEKKRVDNHLHVSKERKKRLYPYAADRKSKKRRKKKKQPPELEGMTLRNFLATRMGCELKGGKQVERGEKKEFVPEGEGKNCFVGGGSVKGVFARGKEVGRQEEGRKAEVRREKTYRQDTFSTVLREGLREYFEQKKKKKGH